MPLNSLHPARLVSFNPVEPQQHKQQQQQQPKYITRKQNRITTVLSLSISFEFQQTKQNKRKLLRRN